MTPQTTEAVGREAALGNTHEKANPPRPTHAEARRHRYRIQGVAQDLLVNENRLSGCMHRRVRPGVEIWANGDKAHYSGLLTCGSVWGCPVCSAKISAQRRGEVEQLVDWWTDQGGEVLLVTFTAPHSRGDSLADWLPRFQDAMQRTKRGAPWKRLQQEVGHQGSVQALEVTWGEANGWHPHRHELWLVYPGTDTQWLQRRLYQRWANMCQRAGLGEPDPEHGVDVRGGEAAQDYLTKWGAGAEVAGFQEKDGRDGHYTPFGLLDKYLDIIEDVELSDDEQQAQREKFSDLFAEYYAVFKGRQQLVWTKGLKALAGIEEVEDEEAAEDYEEEQYPVAVIGPDGWSQVCREHAKLHILELAETGGAHAVEEWFNERGLGTLPVGVVDMPVDVFGSGYLTGFTPNHNVIEPHRRAAPGPNVI